MKKLFLIIFSLLLLLGCAGVPLKLKLQKSLAQLDQTYIPVVVFCNLSRQRPAELAFGRFNQAWQEFYGQYHDLKIKYGLDIVDNEWSIDFELMAAAVTSTEVSIKTRDWASANSSLWRLRKILSSLSKRHGLAYYLDSLASLDDTLDQILKSSWGKNKLSDKGRARLSSLALQAKKEWEKVRSTKIPGKLFHFNATKSKALAKKIASQQATLAELQQAVVKSQGKDIFLVAQNLKSEFTVIYRAFGDFQPIFEQMAAEKTEQKRLSLEAK